MRVQSRGLALVGLAAMALIAVGLLQRRLDVPQAALRATVALVALVVADRLVLPVARALVGEPARLESEPAPPA